MKKNYILFLVSFSLSVYSNKPPTCFIENKGQVYDQNFKPNPEVKFLLNTPGLNIQLKANSFSYDTYATEVKESANCKRFRTNHSILPKTERIYQFHRVDVEFIGANKTPEIIKENPSETYFNFYTIGAPREGITNVRGYEKITYREIYPNIDLECTSLEGKFKYNFILHKGADINQIKWKYNGAENVDLKSQNIFIKVKHGQFLEAIPESYLINNSKKGKSIKVDFVRNEMGFFGFNIKQKINLDHRTNLVVDPNPIVMWCTYFGGTGTECLYSSCLDASNNVFATGYTSSTGGIATSGSYQSTYGGGANDAMIFKLNSNGNVLKWATYYGSYGDDAGYSIVMDKFSNLYVGGWVSDSLSVLSTSGAHQINYGGGPYDAFLAKFDTNGVRIWSTYYGGKGDDGNGALTLDSLNNVYLIGGTSSTTGISTIGSHQPSYGGGTYDAFLAKFNTSGVRQWGTYYGGNGNDNGLAGTTGNNNSVYITGLTSSINSISTPGSHQVGFGGGSDVFIIKFDSNGIRQWGTYYGGSGSNDMGLGIYYDKASGLYVTGETDSNDSIATPGAHQSSFGGGSYTDAFLAKFNSSGARQWATYYGGTDFDYGLCVVTDSGNVYFGGATRSPSSIATTNALQTSLNPGFYGDAILIKFDKSGLLRWGTYYGGALGEQIYSINIPSSGFMYVAGATSSYGMSTAGAYQTSGGGNWEGFCTKFRYSIITSLLDHNAVNNKSNINIFPNPNNGSFIIQTEEDFTFNIANDLGQIVKTISLNNSNNHQFTICDLESGVYFISDKENKKVIRDKIVVVK